MQQPPSSVNSQQAWKMIHDGQRMRSRCSRPVRAEQSLGVLQRLRQHRSQKTKVRVQLMAAQVTAGLAARTYCIPLHRSEAHQSLLLIRQSARHLVFDQVDLCRERAQLRVADWPPAAPVQALTWLPLLKLSLLLAPLAPPPQVARRFVPLGQ